MPLETVLILFAIVVPFAIFAAVLAWAQSRTNASHHEQGSRS